MKKLSLRSGLMGSATMRTAALFGPVLFAGLAGMTPTTASAQTTPAASDDDKKPVEVVVTGSIIRKKSLTSMSPLTVQTAGDLEKRGITTIDQAVQNLSGNNSGALPNSFSSNGAFAAGASGASLRGLTTNSTLVLIDGLRASYYPLADDGTRNFVDLNTIPDAIVDRVEVLQDGASATYGADAIAGVINIITKKQIKGFEGKASVGATEKGGGGSRSLAMTWGKGDIHADGYNFYLSGEYQKNDELRSSDRGYPYNTDDFSQLCAPSVNAAGTTGVNAAGTTCRTNGIQNGIQFDDTFVGVGSTVQAVVIPYNSTNTAAVAGGQYQLLNAAAGCGTAPKVTLTANETRLLSATGKSQLTGATLCQQDNRKLFRIISPNDSRYSLTGHFTAQLSDTSQFYVESTYYHNEVAYGGIPAAIRATTTPAATGVTTSTATLALPAYICARGTTAACTAANGKLNPNNPFAAAGNVARIFYSFGDIPFYTKENSDTFRLASGINGTWGDWGYTADFVAMRSNLDYTQAGRIYVQHLLDVVADGSYNFVDPSKNTQDVRDYVSPTKVQRSDSSVVSLQASASRPLWTLPGGPMTLGLGMAYRYESVNNPSANNDANGPTQRYFTINPFGAVGDRTVSAAFFEIDAPITDRFTVNIAGREDSYSTHYSSFSPKVSARWKVLDQLSFRGTISKGFRAPAFAETNSDPTTGFVTVAAPPLDTAALAAFNASHGNDSYGLNYSLGITTLGAKNLKPEKSDNTSFGVVFQPTRNIGFTLDYYKIEKHDVISGGDYGPALVAYYTGKPIPAGFSIVASPVDPLYPTALPSVAYVITQKQNLQSQVTSGFDFGVTGRFNLGKVAYSTAFQGTFISYFNQSSVDAAGKVTTQKYAGTLGPYQTTSASGTPKLRYNWQNTFDFGKASVTATAYYTSGYKEKADDNNDIGHDTCDTYATAAKYRDGKTVVRCAVDSFVDVDVHGSYKISDHYSMFLDISNLLGAKPPYDPTTYGASNYNPAWSNAGIVGRSFKITGKVTF